MDDFVTRLRASFTVSRSRSALASTTAPPLRQPTNGHGSAMSGKGRSGDRIAPTRVPHPAEARPETPALISPKFISEAEKKVIMGEIRRPPSPPSLNLNLEAALDRWKRAAEGQGLFGSGQ